VLPRQGHGDIVKACLSSCHMIWSQVTVLHLKQNMRLEALPEDQEFANWLLQIGDGKHTAADGTMELPAGMACADSNIDTLINSVYPDITQRQHDSYLQSVLSSLAVMWTLKTLIPFCWIAFLGEQNHSMLSTRFRMNQGPQTLMEFQ
jgi:hypothetical protein